MFPNNGPLVKLGRLGSVGWRMLATALCTPAHVALIAFEDQRTVATHRYITGHLQNIFRVQRLSTEIYLLRTVRASLRQRLILRRNVNYRFPSRIRHQTVPPNTTHQLPLSKGRSGTCDRIPGRSYQGAELTSQFRQETRSLVRMDEACHVSRRKPPRSEVSLWGVLHYHMTHPIRRAIGFPALTGL